MAKDDLDADVSTGTELTLVVDDDGVMVLGDPGTVEIYVERLRHVGAAIRGSGVTTQSLADAGAAVSALAALGATDGSYFQMAPDSLTLFQQHGAIPGSTGYFKGIVHDGHHFAGNLDFKQATFAAEQAMSLQLAMATIALRAAINEVGEAVARVEGKVDDLVVATKAELTGRILGHHKTLCRRVQEMERTGALPTVDWDAIAGLEPDVNASVEELRAFARGRIDQLKSGLPAAERAGRLRIAVDEAHLGDVLQMLVIAEDSLYQWQRLRIERARGTEPQHVEEIVRFAREQLAADLKADADLVGDLRQALIEYAEPHPLEAPRFLSRKKIAAGIERLRTQLDEFVEARRLQVTEWPAIEQPTIRDARIEIGRRAVEGGRAARRGATEVIDLTVTKAKQAGRTVGDRARRVGRGE